MVLVIFLNMIFIIIPPKSIRLPATLSVLTDSELPRRDKPWETPLWQLSYH